jgi:hypothetical protein
MKFIKRFYQLFESSSLGGNLVFVYPTCNSTYGYIEWNETTDLEGAFDSRSTEPCPFDMEENYLAEDPELEEEGNTILAKQTGGVYDEEHDYDHSDEEYQNWKDEKTSELREKYNSTDLWGTVWAMVVKQPVNSFLGNPGSDGSMPSKKEWLSNEIMGNENIVYAVEVTGEPSTTGLIGFIEDLCQKDLYSAAVIYNSLESGSQKDSIKKRLQEIGEWENLKSVSRSQDFGVI